MLCRKRVAMAQGWNSAKKSHGWSFQTDHSWILVLVAVACTCSCVYVLQLLFINSSNCIPLESISYGFRHLPPQQMMNISSPSILSSTDTHHTASLDALPVPVPVPVAVRLQTGKTRKTTDLTRIVFGIAGAAKMWATRKEYVKLWWNSVQGLRGYVWLDEKVNETWSTDVPPFKISGDTSRFEYKFRGGKRSAIRISRIVSEMFRLGLPDVDWFVMGDDDTFFFPDNLVKVLNKYDHNQMYYIGSTSETHMQNVLFSYNMAFGGGGFAISYPLAKELAKMQDACLARYAHLFGSDDRMHACMSELGVSLTRELGFHQMDIQGDAFGLLAAHPQTPLVSLHHLDAILPIFPNYTRGGALTHLLKASKIEPSSLLQQSICYAHGKTWSISLSWGFVVQIYKEFLTPRVLETTIRTFASCRRRTDKVDFPFNTRDNSKEVCLRPSLFYMESARGPSADTDGFLETVYVKGADWKKRRACDSKLKPLSSVQRIRVLKEPIKETWFLAPRRSCCRVTSWQEDTIEMHVGACEDGEVLMSSSQ